MPADSRVIVKACLDFDYPARLPRQIWMLPGFANEHPDMAKRINEMYPGDLGHAPGVCSRSPLYKGDPYTPGLHTDEWGCTFTNIQAGVIGEVKDPILGDTLSWRDYAPPYDILPSDIAGARDKVDRACGASSMFILAACCPRPWERYQFLRGTENAMMDIMLDADEALVLLGKIHGFYMRELEFWVKTGVDGINFMDDWGAQRQLLIPPALWREYFKPLYKDYCDIAHAAGKYVFMHSDGYIQEIYPDLVEIGVDALNSQLFCMDMAELAMIARGRLAFWGEIDRQHVMPAKDSKKGRDAVRKVASHLYDPAGGVIVQFELTPGSNPDVALAVLEEWEKVNDESAACVRGISMDAGSDFQGSEHE